MVSQTVFKYQNGRDDGKPCDIYWHNIVYGDMKNVVNSANARVNKFPGIEKYCRVGNSRYERAFAKDSPYALDYVNAEDISRGVFILSKGCNLLVSKFVSPGSVLPIC